MDVKTHLKQGVAAAKAGRNAQAQTHLYAVIDADRANEAAWMWLSYVVDTVEDRRVCLQNVLTINPKNTYAQRGLRDLNAYVNAQQPINQETAVDATAIAPTPASTTLTPGKTKTTSPETPTGPAKPVIAPAKPTITQTDVAGATIVSAVANGSAPVGPQSSSRPATLLLSVAFWAGLGLFLLIIGLVDVVAWWRHFFLTGDEFSQVTPYQLWLLSIPIPLIILGVLTLNVAWAMFSRYKIGYYLSILFAFGFAFLGPLTLLLAGSNNWMVIIFAAILPAIVVFLTVLSQTGFIDDNKLAPNAG